MILSKDSEKLLKRLARQRKEYERKCNKENECASPFSVTNTFSEIEKILPNQSYVSLRGLLNYLLKEKYIFNNIKGKEDHISTSDVEEDIMQIFIGEKGVAYLNHKKYVVRCVRYVLKVRRTHILILNFKGAF